MCEQRLPKFSTYLERLELFAKAHNINLVYSDKCSSLGEFIPSRNKIILETTLSESEEIAVLLHELGHSLDDDLMTNKKYIYKLNKALQKLNNNYSCTEEQHRIILDCEYRAWTLAEVIAKRLKIPLGKWFYKVKTSCLKGYK